MLLYRDCYGTHGNAQNFTEVKIFFIVNILDHFDCVLSYE